MGDAEGATIDDLHFCWRMQGKMGLNHRFGVSIFPHLLFSPRFRAPAFLNSTINLMDSDFVGSLHDVVKP